VTASPRADPAPGQDWMMMPEVSEAWVPVLSVTVIVKE
jgi:hypothetical protein